jgi:hypothetical protein
MEWGFNFQCITALAILPASFNVDESNETLTAVSTIVACLLIKWARRFRLDMLALAVRLVPTLTVLRCYIVLLASLRSPHYEVRMHQQHFLVYHTKSWRQYQWGNRRVAG